MARYVVDVMPKPEILDPQGKAVHGALPRLGFAGVADVRQGKRFEIELEGEASDDHLEQVRQMAEKLLSNPVIEDFEVRHRMKVGIVTFPGSLDDVDARRAVRHRRPRGSRAVARRRRPQGGRRSGAARRLLLRRLPPLRRHLALRAGDDLGHRGRRHGHAGPRHLQRLPDPLRVPPPSRGVDPQRPPQVRLPRPAPAHRARRHPVDVCLRRRRRGDHRAQER